MKFIRKWFQNQVKIAWETRYDDEADEVIAVSKSRGLNKSSPRVSVPYGSEDVIAFRVYTARGGMVVECMTHDEKRDREQVRLHVIPDSDDFSESLSKIVTMEYLQR